MLEEKTLSKTFAYVMSAKRSAWRQLVS